MKAVASKVQKARKPQARPGELFLLLCAGATAAPSFWCISAAVWAVLLVNSSTTSRQQWGSTPGMPFVALRAYLKQQKMDGDAQKQFESNASRNWQKRRRSCKRASFSPSGPTSRKRKACKCTSRPSTRCPCIGSAREGRGSELTHVVSFLLLCNDCITGAM